jgi:hypothetical protein
MIPGVAAAADDRSQTCVALIEEAIQKDQVCRGGRSTHPSSPNAEQLTPH